MGCIVGLIAGVVALLGGFFLGGWTRPWLGDQAFLVGVAFGVLVVLVGFLLVYSGGHRAFGSGTNTDLPLFVAGVGIVFAVIIPRFTSFAACATRDDFGRQLVRAQEAFHADSGRYFTDPEMFVEGLDLPEAVEEATTITIEEVTDSSFVASVTYSRCDDGEPLRVLFPSPEEPVP